MKKMNYIPKIIINTAFMLLGKITETLIKTIGPFAFLKICK